MATTSMVTVTAEVTEMGKVVGVAEVRETMGSHEGATPVWPGTPATTEDGAAAKCWGVPNSEKSWNMMI
jgi:hypothetical protein